MVFKDSKRSDTVKAPICGGAGLGLPWCGMRGFFTVAMCLALFVQMSASQMNTTLAASTPAMLVLDGGNGNDVKVNCTDSRSDVMILVDASSSLSVIQFNQVKQALSALVDRLPISRQGMRMSLTLFAQQARVAFGLTQYFDKAEMKRAIARQQMMRGEPNLPVGLNAQRTLIAPDLRRTNNANVTHTLLIITDNQNARHSDALLTAYNQLRREVDPLYVYGVSVGLRSVQDTSANPFASLTRLEHLYRPRNFAALRTLMSTIARDTCLVSKPCGFTYRQVSATCQAGQRVVEEITREWNHARGTCMRRTRNVGARACGTAGNNVNKNGTLTGNLTGRLTTGGNKVMEQCEERTNLVVVLDSSTSIGVKNHQLAREFLQTLIHEQQIERKGMHVALVQFSTLPKLEFDLGRYNTSQQVEEAISRLRLLGGATRMADALRLTRESILSRLPNAATKVLLLITDGRADRDDIARDEAQLIRDLGVRLVAVGVGNDISVEQLRSMSDGRMVLVENYNELKRELATVTRNTCTDAGSTLECRREMEYYLSPCEAGRQSRYSVSYRAVDNVCRRRQRKMGELACTHEVPCGEEKSRELRDTECVAGKRKIYQIKWRYTPCGCVMEKMQSGSISCDPLTGKDNGPCQKADVVFIMDDSSSVNADSFPQQVNFVKQLVASFDLDSPSKVRVALATFNTRATVHMQFNTYAGPRASDRIINYVTSKLKYQGGRSHIGNALRRVRLSVLEESRRASVPTVVYLLSDGRNNGDRSMRREARMMKAAYPAVDLIPIKVGASHDLKALKDISSSGEVYDVSQVTKLIKHFIDNYKAAYC